MLFWIALNEELHKSILGKVKELEQDFENIPELETAFYDFDSWKTKRIFALLLTSKTIKNP